MAKIKRAKEKRKAEYSEHEVWPGEYKFQKGAKIKMIQYPINLPNLNKKKKKRIKELDALGFTPDSIHVIKEAPGKYLNTSMAVFVKGKDGKLYQIQFAYFLPLGIDKNDNPIEEHYPTSMVEEKPKKKKDKKKKKKKKHK